MRVAQLVSTEDPRRTDKQAVEIISAASSCQSELIILPVEQLSDDFLNLRTRVAGEVLQKFVTYRKRVVILVRPELTAPLATVSLSYRLNP